MQVQKMKYVVSHIKVPVNKLSGEQSEYNSKIYQCRVRYRDFIYKDLYRKEKNVILDEVF